MRVDTAGMAAFWVVTGMALIAISDNFIPLIAERMGLWQFQTLRAGVVLPIVLLSIIALGRVRQIVPLSAWRIAVRSLFAIVALMLYFAALPAVSIAVAAAGLFTGPFWVMLFSALFYGERVAAHRVLSGVIGFVGVALVLGLGAEPLHPMALVAVLGGAFYGMSVIWTRRECADETAICMAFWQFVGFILIGLAGLAALPWIGWALAGVEGAEFAMRPWQPVDRSDILLALVIGGTGLLATACIATGYKSAESSFIGVFDFSFLVWAPLIAWLAWGEAASPRVLAGMALIVAAGMIGMLFGGRPRPARGRAPGAASRPVRYGSAGVVNGAVNGAAKG